jgi:hypothetical protein
MKCSSRNRFANHDGNNGISKIITGNIFGKEIDKAPEAVMIKSAEALPQMVTLRPRTLTSEYILGKQKIKTA